MNSLIGEAVPAVKGNGFLYSLTASESSIKVLLAERRGEEEYPWFSLMFALDCFIKITPLRKAYGSHKTVTKPQEF